jgi:hypothetical protein
MKRTKAATTIKQVNSSSCESVTFDLKFSARACLYANFAKHFVDLPNKAGKFEEMQKCSLIPSNGVVAK